MNVHVGVHYFTILRFRHIKTNTDTELNTKMKRH